MNGTGSGKMLSHVLAIAAAIAGVAFVLSADRSMILVLAICGAGSVVAWIIGVREDRYVISRRLPGYRHRDWM